MSCVPSNKLQKRSYGISEEQPFLVQRKFFPNREVFALVKYCNDHTNYVKRVKKIVWMISIILCSYFSKNSFNLVMRKFLATGTLVATLRISAHSSRKLGAFQQVSTDHLLSYGLSFARYTPVDITGEIYSIPWPACVWGLFLSCTTPGTIFESYQ